MLHGDFCLAKAEECELRAAETADRPSAREWLWMASEWRLAATLEPPPPRRGREAPRPSPSRPPA
jgi:hypothetical protein